MSYTPSVEDTQPRSPFQDNPDLLKPTIDPEADGGRGGSGCGVMGLIGAILLVFGVAIVALAGAAGWTAGQREANTLAANTRQAQINEQLQRIPGDVADGNTVLLDTRIRWLATQTPGVNGLAELVQTATAVYLNTLPTATPTPSPTAEAETATVEAQATEELALTPSSGGGYDLASLYQQAQTAMASSQWQNAISALDVILGIDPTYESASVRRMMSQSLQNRAMELYNANQPAAANLLVNRAEEFGQIDSSLDFERYAAELYLTARNAVGTGNQTVFRALRELINMGAGGRYYNEAQQLLYNQYVLLGDAYAAQGDYCGAAAQYQSAMSVFASGAANGKYDNAQNICLNSTPTLDPNFMLTPGAVAPVGVVTPPGM